MIGWLVGCEEAEKHVYWQTDHSNQLFYKIPKYKVSLLTLNKLSASSRNQAVENYRVENKHSTMTSRVWPT